MQVIRGKQTKNDEMIRLYIEEFFEKFDEVERSILLQKVCYLFFNVLI